MLMSKAKVEKVLKYTQAFSTAEGMCQEQVCKKSDIISYIFNI